MISLGLGSTGAGVVVVGGYERVGVVSRGAQSTLWKGFDPGLKREVALKQLTGSGAGEAARREAAVLAGLRHPNILSVYDVLDEGGRGVWLIEQWITGAPLSAVVAETGKLRVIDGLALIHGALQGLSYAHGREVVHGDVSPGNILIDQSGTPILVDFGLAVSPGQTSLGGTPGYMAPEAASGHVVDTRSDVYSCCVVLAELLTGTRLFDATSSLGVIHRQARIVPPLPGIEAPVAAVLTAGLDPHPDDRPADAATLLARLEEAIEKSRGRGWIAGAGLGAIGSTAATIATGETLTSTAGAGTTTTAATTSKPATSTIGRAKIIGAAAAALIVALIGFLLLRPTPLPRETAQPILPAGALTTAPPLAAQSTASVYMIHFLSQNCTMKSLEQADHPTDVFRRGNSVTILGATGPVNADGSFVATGYNTTVRGVFTTDSGQSVINDGEWNSPGLCDSTFKATKQ